MKNSSRKATLLRLLNQVGQYPGAGLHRTPGEDAAIAIAVGLIARTQLKKLDEVAHDCKKVSEPFWSKQW